MLISVHVDHRFRYQSASGPRDPTAPPPTAKLSPGRVVSIGTSIGAALPLWYPTR